MKLFPLFNFPFKLLFSSAETACCMTDMFPYFRPTRRTQSNLIELFDMVIPQRDQNSIPFGDYSISPPHCSLLSVENIIYLIFSLHRKAVMNGNQVRGKQKKYRLLLFENRVDSCDKSARDYGTISNVISKKEIQCF